MPNINQNSHTLQSPFAIKTGFEAVVEKAVQKVAVQELQREIVVVVVDFRVCPSASWKLVVLAAIVVGVSLVCTRGLADILAICSLKKITMIKITCEVVRGKALSRNNLHPTLAQQ